MLAKVQGVVRVAIIGTGGISGAHAAGYKKYADKAQVVALCDINPDALKRRSVQLGGGGTGGAGAGGTIRLFNDYKIMLAEAAADFDAVDICLPHHLHGPAILAAAAAKKHILCEKPMCISLDEAEQIAVAVESAGITYMSAHNQLFMPVIQEARKMIDAGEIGRVLYVRSQDCFIAGASGKGNRHRWGWRASAKTQGGGELIDTGYHPVYRLLHLANSPAVEVRSSMGRFRNEIDGEDSASISVRFASGAIGEILSSWAFNNPFGTHQIHVIGEKGQIFGSENLLFHLPNSYSEPAKKTFDPVDTFEAEIRHFLDCLLEGKRPIHSVAEGRAVLELILQATQSANGWQQSAVMKPASAGV
jgi:predicted dehydrogenase